ARERARAERAGRRGRAGDAGARRARGGERVGGGLTSPPLKRRVWVGVSPPPRPFRPGGRPALTHHPGGGTAGKLRVGTFAAGMRLLPRTPPPGSIPTFPHPGCGGEAGWPPG